jgi:hypothetical protein
VAQELQSGKQTYFSIAYSGNNIWNPGANFAYSRILDRKDNPAAGKTNSLEMRWRASTGFYLDPGSHWALFSNAGIGFRKPGNRVVFTFSLSPAGIYRSFLTETYLVNADEVKKVFLPGNFYYSPGAGFDIGRKLADKPESEIFGGIQVITLIPYNTYLMPLVHMRIGLRFASKGGRL